SLCYLFFLSFDCLVVRRDLHSFPTRRSSDLGNVSISMEREAALFKDTPQQQTVWMENSLPSIDLPTSFSIDANRGDSEVVSFSNEEKKLFGVLFHPEKTETEYGSQLLQQFLFAICKCEGKWTPENFIQMEIENIRQTVGN